jgi:hypothetical protein
MIDIAHENLIALHQVPKHLPRRPNGKTLHLSAVYRWSTVGVRGTKLETLKIGGTQYTSEQALQRFANNLTGSSAPAPVTHVSRNRRAQARRAEQEIRQQLGISDRPGRSPSAQM